MSPGRVTKDGCSGRVDPRVRRHCQENVIGREAYVLKSSRPTATRVTYPSVLYVARDNSLGRKGGAKMPDMRQVINGPPKTTMDNEEQRERSFALGKPDISEVARIIPITDANVENR